LLITLKSEKPWTGKLYFDKTRYQENMKLPLDWPRINQFPEWFTLNATQEYHITDINKQTIGDLKGEELMQGIVLKMTKSDSQKVFFLRKGRF